MGQVFDGRFEVVGELVRRTSCVVYLAKDRTLGDREVALKVYPDQPGVPAEVIKSFQDEITVLRSASHPVLVPIIAGGYDNGAFFLALERIEGRTLYEIIKAKQGPLDLDFAVNTAKELADALGEMHEKKILHGHLDSRAVMLQDSRIRLAGYCPDTIERMLRAATSQGQLMIDPAYVSPEQVQGADDVDGRTDVYGLAVLLFEMVTGQKPFSATNPLQAAMARLTQFPPSPKRLNPNVSPLLDAAILKGLAKETKDRFQTMREFSDAVCGGKTVKNPFTEGAAPERIGGTETIAVSMSTEKIKEILKSHDASRQSAPESEAAGAETSATATVVHRPAPITGGQPLDVAATSVGMSASSGLSASVLVTRGQNRSKRYALDKGQTMIGSDPSCDICFGDKEVARRHAILVKRGEDYFVESLQSGGVVINGKHEKAEEGLQLKRGDILTIGDNDLRFVAPGEVFTLHDDVADRVIDRPKSKLPLYVGVLALGLAVICGGLVYQYLKGVERQKAITAAKEHQKNAEREERVAQLRREGDEFLKQGALIEPAGANAMERFQSVLELNPDDSYAKRRVQEIQDRNKAFAEEQTRKELIKQKVAQLLTDADRYFQNKDFIAPPGRNARETYQQVLSIEPSNQTATERIAKIDELLGQRLDQINGVLAEARRYKEQGQYVLPPGQNAFESYQQVLKVDPKNREALEATMDMAARSVFAGDQAKLRADAKEMRKSYLVAQALGADPNYINSKLQGAKLLETAKSSVIIYDRKDDEVKTNTDGGRYLDTKEIERRVGLLAIEARNQEGQPKDRLFIDLNADDAQKTKGKK